MTLTQKFANLTPEQLARFATVKNAATLEKFTSEYSIEFTEEEKAQMAEYFKKGILPLADDDLDKAAGGISDFNAIILTNT